MQNLAIAVSRLNSVSALRQIFPEFVISNETRTLYNVRHWIEVWNDNWKSFQNGNVREIIKDKLVKRETALERLIKSSHVSTSSYAKQIASWAALAGSFPEYLTLHPTIKEQKITMSEYWQWIIIHCAKEKDIFSIPSQDVFDLWEHIQTNIPYGTIQSALLFKILKKVVQQHKEFMSLGESNLDVSYEILEENAILGDTDSAALVKIIDSATQEPPKRSDYASSFEYLKAKMRYNLAKNAEKS